MQLTPNYRLRKPDGTDPVDVQDLNDNMDVLDAEVAKKAEKTGAATDMVVAFKQEEKREQLESGEKLSLSLGKIKKWFADLKKVAFSGDYADLTGKPAIPAGGIADASKIIDDIDDIAANTQAGYMAGALALKKVNSDLGALNDGGAIKGLEVREGDGVYITYADGADTVSKKLGNTKITFDISGSGDNPNYLSSAVFQFHRTSFDGFFAAGYKKCKIVFSSFSGTQSTGRLEIRKNGVTSTYYSNPGTVEFNLAKGDYIAGYVAEQATFRFGASVTMSG